jgi:hypothetical protein
MRTLMRRRRLGRAAIRPPVVTLTRGVLRKGRARLRQDATLNGNDLTVQEVTELARAA